MSGPTKRQAHAARRAHKARSAYAAAASPEERLRAAYDWFRAARLPARTVDAVARQLMRLAERADARASGRTAATHPSDSGDERLAS